MTDEQVAKITRKKVDKAVLKIFLQEPKGRKLYNFFCTMCVYLGPKNRLSLIEWYRFKKSMN